MRERPFELRDDLQRFVRKFECESRSIRGCRAGALRTWKFRRFGGDLALHFTLGFVLDGFDERDLFITRWLRVTEESVRLCDVGDRESPIADRGSDLGKILNESHGFYPSLRLIFGVAKFFDGVVEERRALVVAVELSALDFFKVDEDVGEEAALFADQRK